jgi:molybdate transport repressor ModE-like protein
MTALTPRSIETTGYLDAFDLITTLQAAAEHGTYKATGEAMHLHNRSVKYRIKQLEKITGKKLIESITGRNGGIQLTEAGKQLLANSHL